VVRGAGDIGVVGDWFGTFAGVFVVDVDGGKFGARIDGLGVIIDFGALEGDDVFLAGA
jgi:hypothetical protein